MRLISLLGLICVVVTSLSCVCCTGCNTTYSEGYRDGEVQKFSHKGFFFKSWEGELSLPGFKLRDGYGSNVFYFSVDNPAIVDELKDLAPGQLVRVHYREVLLNAPVYYSSSYRVTKIEKVK